jgi:anionic cell wall polymer biosynthesis LytR-Cps2A-Psr (LCP) family protein
VLDQDIPQLAQPAESADTTPLNFLVLGSDSDSRSPDARGFDVTGDRADTIMVVHVVAGRKAAFVFSIPATATSTCQRPGRGRAA